MEAFDNLLRALHNAVIEAQKLTEQQHHRQLRRYFYQEKDGVDAELIGQPKTMSIKIPDIRPNARAPYRVVEVPDMAIMPPSAVKIKELRIGFQVKLVGFVDEPNSRTGFAIAGEKKTHSGPLYAEVGGQVNETDPNLAKVEVIFEGTDPPEALFRLIEIFNKALPS